MKAFFTAVVFISGIGVAAHAEGDAASHADRVEKRGEERKAHLNQKAARIEENAKKRADHVREKAERVDANHEKRANHIREKVAKREARKAERVARNSKK